MSREASGDGVTIETGDSDYEPDALIRCGLRGADDASVVPNPVVVAEIPSPATAAVDRGQELAEYFGPTQYSNPIAIAHHTTAPPH